MDFKYKQEVEICKKEKDGSTVVSYYPARILAAVGKSRFIIEYSTQFRDVEKSRPLIATVEDSEIRPMPPRMEEDRPGLEHYREERRSVWVDESDRVDVYLEGVWWVGKITRKVDPNYYVRLERDVAEGETAVSREVHCGFYRVRVHLEFDNGQWMYSRKKQALSAL